MLFYLVMPDYIILSCADEGSIITQYGSTVYIGIAMGGPAL